VNEPGVIPDETLPAFRQPIDPFQEMGAQAVQHHREQNPFQILDMSFYDTIIVKK